MSRTQRVEGSRTVPIAPAIDRQLPPRTTLLPATGPTAGEVEQALLDLRRRARESESGLELELGPDEESVRVYTRRDGRRHLLRAMTIEELLRLARMARAGRPQLLDLKL